MAQSRHSKSASQHSKAASQHSKTEPQADPAPAPTNVPVPATAPAPAQLALFSTLASAAKLLLEALGSRDLKADNHFTLETLRRAIQVSEPYIEIVLRELERHEISTQAGPSRSRQDGKRASKPESKSNSLLRVLPKIISIAAQLAKTREKRPNGSVRLTLLQELHEFLRVEIKAARKEVKRLEHVLEGKHKRLRHRGHRGEKGRGGDQGKKAIAVGGEKGNGGGEGENGDGGEDDDDDEEDGSDGDGDGDGYDNGAPLLRSGPAASDEAASIGEERRSAAPSGDKSSQHNDNRALVIRVQSPSTHRSERMSSRASSMAASKFSRSGSHNTGSITSKKPSSRHIVEGAPSAAKSRSGSTQRKERLSSLEGPIEVPPSPHPASSHSRSSVSRKWSSRHIVEESSAVRSQSYSTQGSRRVSNSTASELASSSLHPGSDHTKSIASRDSSKRHLVDQVPAARSQSRSTQRTDAGSKRHGSVKAAPSSCHESIGPTLVVSKDLSRRQVVDQARSRSPSTQKSERASSRTSLDPTSKASSCLNNDARSAVSKASSRERVVEQEPVARSRGPGMQRAEGTFNITVPVHHAGGRPKSIVSRASSNRHVVASSALFETQCPSPEGKKQASDLSGSVRVTNNASRSISSRASSSRHIVDQPPVTGVQSPGPETKEGASKFSNSVRDASNHSSNVSSRASSSRQVVHQPPITERQSQNTQKRTNNATDSIRHPNKTTTSVSSKASSSYHSRVTRAPTISSSSSRSSSPSSTVANVDDSKAQRSRPVSATKRPNRALQSSSSASHRSQPRSKVPSPAPSEQHIAFPKPRPSNDISVHAIEKEKPSLTLRISDIHDGQWTFQQLPVNNAGESKKSKRSKGFCENLT